ncbi:MAG: hypothetical protein V7L05_11450 [Nostoc sp.]|uniref:hypothetical protein n=1 Tax=Nostoc sp. TaxID=1180 RepID=UPI002FFA5288
MEAEGYHGLIPALQGKTTTVVTAAKLVPLREEIDWQAKTDAGVRWSVLAVFY